jgi:hypothetical protein
MKDRVARLGAPLSSGDGAQGTETYVLTPREGTFPLIGRAYGAVSDIRANRTSGCQLSS